MDLLCDILVFSGSALMVFNIWRCYGFVHGTRDLSIWQGKGHLLRFVPLVFLVMFLLGYAFVGITGGHDLVVSGILWGGSVFVAIVLGIMYSIIDRLREGHEHTKSLYDEMRNELDDLAKDYTSIMRVNLTKDVIEEIHGSNLYPTDLNCKTYSGLIRERGRWLLEPIDGTEDANMTREGLITSYETGRTVVEETLFCQLHEGPRAFVLARATLALHPITNDIMAFITERVCNDDLVSDAIMSKALIGQFDMITYLLDGRYSVVIGDEHRSRGSIFPHQQNGLYIDYLNDQVAPVIRGTSEEREAAIEALSSARIEEELKRHEPYEVTIACDINGEVFYKSFVFYVISQKAKFYLLLKSDTTDARSEEMRRNELLSAALEQAEHASAAKSTFLSNMSHDIRTPMNAIVGYTEFALRTDDPDQMQRYLRKIDTSSQYLLSLINDVLEMSRIESGKMELELSDVDLLSVAAGIRSMFGTQMADKGIAFTVTAEGMRHNLVRCDLTRLNRVLLNLVSNAFKFTPEGGSVTLTFDEREAWQQGYSQYVIRVKDTGIGMSEEFSARVFDAFERERNTTASGIQGTGLGMAITKRIVDLMRGTIEVNSTLGEGTEFVVRIELEQCDVTADATAVYTAVDADEVDLTGVRALLAEDNEINREIACMLLEELGIEVEAAVNGQEALDMLVDAGPGYYDIVVTDIQMPVLDGYEEARAIRQLSDPQLANIPMIAMSANAFQEDIRAARDAGIDGYVSKPIDLSVLTEELARVLGDK